MEEEAKEELTLFIYCDGSSKPNPGPSGYGVHMVLGSNLIKPKNIIGKYKLTTDGYITNVEFKNSKNKELLGLFKCIEIYGYEDSSDTNNMGELDAVIQSINMLDTIIDSIETKPSKLVFLLDSTYVINNIEKVRTKDFDMSSINANRTKVNKLKKMFDKIENKYDITIKTDDGYVEVKDGKGNSIKLNSKLDTLTVKTNATINLISTAMVNVLSATVNIKSARCNINP